jgi:hypothetical protein
MVELVEEGDLRSTVLTAALEEILRGLDLEHPGGSAGTPKSRDLEALCEVADEVPAGTATVRRGVELDRLRGVGKVAER